ncbi:unnamed protein product [Linum tenue]|uniref:Uncharacterized protein n=1 Tax=Linum tenue TaxID=586396 RepID=A0AAV0IWA8_9ROSI|nr:unnamed protein product [Linum tenue]
MAAVPFSVAVGAFSAAAAPIAADPPTAAAPPPLPAAPVAAISPPNAPPWSALPAAATAVEPAPPPPPERPRASASITFSSPIASHIFCDSASRARSPFNRDRRSCSTASAILSNPILCCSCQFCRQDSNVLLTPLLSILPTLRLVVRDNRGNLRDPIGFTGGQDWKLVNLEAIS